MSDVCTGEIMKHNLIDLCEIDITLCPLQSLFNDQLYHKRLQYISWDIVSCFLTRQIMKQNFIELCETADTVCLLCSLFNEQMYDQLSQ